VSVRLLELPWHLQPAASNWDAVFILQLNKASERGEPARNWSSLMGGNNRNGCSVQVYLIPEEGNAPAADFLRIIDDLRKGRRPHQRVPSENEDEVMEWAQP